MDHPDLLCHLLCLFALITLGLILALTSWRVAMLEKRMTKLQILLDKIKEAGSTEEQKEKKTGK